MDAFISSFRNLCNEIMPILGAVCLVCVIILLIRLIKVIGSLDDTLLKTHGTIDLVDETIEKVQAPLDTAVKLSGTIDKAHDAAIGTIEESKEMIVDVAEGLKNKLVKVLSDEEKKEETKDPDPEDVIGG